VLVQRLGEGGFGEVWKARGAGGLAVALKFIRLGGKAGGAELRALEVMKDVRHANLLGVFGAWQQEGQLILAMELADGTLLDRLNAALKQGLPGIPLGELLEYMRDAARGLDHLNAIRIQHRDVKPQNLLLVGGSVKVGDFGLAKVLHHTLSGHTGAYTPAYVAPEFLSGQTSGQSDQYALAVSYCQLRGGRLPFEGHVTQVLTGHAMHPPDLTMLPESERPAAARALAKEPKERWPSCRAFVDALAAEVTPRLLPGPRASGRERGRGVRRAMLLLLLGLGLLGLALLVVGGRWSASGPNKDGGSPETKDDPPPRELTNTLGMKLVRIEPGTFRMGSPESDTDAGRGEKPQHEVRITRPFYMAVHPVTVGQFRQFVQQKKYVTEAERAGDPSTWDKPGWDQKDRHPVVFITWNDAVAFCEWLSKKEGRTYELPFEAEWEYACRAGTTTRYFFGDDADRLDECGWYNGNSGIRAQEVGTKKPNGWGLYDMHGNVWQWCADGTREYPKEVGESPIEDPKGQLDGPIRVLRGGSRNHLPRDCRAACRLVRNPDARHAIIGFRVVLRPGAGTP
jgi:formylglycine-generating enzyme required for sulfatase activity